MLHLWAMLDPSITSSAKSLGSPWAVASHTFALQRFDEALIWTFALSNHQEMVYVDWQERLKTKAELFGNWDRNASLDIAKVWGHRQDWRLQDRDLAHLRCRGGTNLLKSRSPEIILHHFVDTADTCRLLLGLATAYQQMSFAFRSMDALIIWNHNAICSFGWHSTTHLFAVLDWRNGILVTRSARWPLCVDPQMQIVTWLKKKEEKVGQAGNRKRSSFRFCLEKSLLVKAGLTVKTFNDEYVKFLELAIQYGKPFLFENLDEDLDPMVEGSLVLCSTRQFFQRCCLDGYAMICSC